MATLPHDPDIRALLRGCNVHDVPLAMNLATADLVIAAGAPVPTESQDAEHEV